MVAPFGTATLFACRCEGEVDGAQASAALG